MSFEYIEAHYNQKRQYSLLGYKSPMLDELLTATNKVERGVPLFPELDQAVLHRSSLGVLAPRSCLRMENTSSSPCD
jgi:hypothetical protein